MTSRRMASHWGEADPAPVLQDGQDEDEDDDHEGGCEGGGVAVEEDHVASVVGLLDDGVAGDAAIGGVGVLPHAAGRVERRAVRHGGYQRSQKQEVLAQAVLPRAAGAAGLFHCRRAGPAALSSVRPGRGPSLNCGGWRR
jgi:hypothetical protein